MENKIETKNALHWLEVEHDLIIPTGQLLPNQKRALYERYHTSNNIMKQILLMRKPCQQ